MTLLQVLKSDYIVNCEAIYDWQGLIYIIIEYMEGRSLMDIVAKSNLFYSEEFCKYTIYCVAQALKHMHARNVKHRDIKLENVLLRSDGTVKLCDLGLSSFRPNDDWQNTYCGTRGYMAPEILLRQGYTKSVDVFALGVLAHELATKLNPYQGTEHRMMATLDVNP